MKFACPHCQQSLEADDSFAGGNVDCPTCGKQFVVEMEQPVAQIEPPKATPQFRVVSQPKFHVTCPHCKRNFQAEASAMEMYANCPVCGKRFRLQAVMSRGTKGGENSMSEELSIAPALVFQSLLLVSLLVGAFFPPVLVLALVLLIPCLICVLNLHYKCWQALPAKFARTTPGKAVGYLFIPFFMLYWIFPSVGGLGADCAAMARHKGIQGYGHLGGLGTAAALLQLVGFVGQFIPVAGFFIAIAEFILWIVFYRGVTNLLNRVAR